MKRKIDLDKAAEAEVYGCLALRAGTRKEARQPKTSEFTRAQSRALAAMARSMFEVANEHGAYQLPIVVEDISIDLRKSGPDQILSIRTVSKTPIK